jgi:proteasome alpha subunit
VAGVDETGPRLFETDPSGALIEYRASAVGAGRTQALDVLEKDYKEGMSEEAAIQLGLRALHAGTEGKFNPDALEIAAVTASPAQGQGGFRLLSAEDVKAAVKASQGGKE